MSVFDGLAAKTKGAITTQTIWSSRELSSAQEDAVMSALATDAYINYLPITDDSHSGFLPMIFDHAHCTVGNVQAAAAYGSILAFNEPDAAPPQASMTVAQALSDWNTIIVPNKGTARLGSPVCANNMSTPGGWFDQFMSDASAPNPDFICMHRYSSNFASPSTAATAIMTEVLQVYNRWRRPIKFTEFGMINFNGSADPTVWTFPTEAQYIAFLQDIVARFRATPEIETFVPYPTTVSQALLDANAGWLNVILCDLSGNLTNVGRAYRDAIQIRR